MSKAGNILNNLWDMANLSPEETNLPVVVFVSPKGNAKHSARIKVMKHVGRMNIKDTVSVTLYDYRVIGGELDSKILKDVIKWIDLNKDILLKYWNNEIGTIALAHSLKTL